MMYFEFVVILLCFAVQVKCLSKADVDEITKKCVKNLPDSQEEYSSELGQCLLVDSKVLDENGAIDKDNLKELLATKYADQKFISELVDLCAVKKNKLKETAYFIFHSCYLTPYEDLDAAKNSIAFLDCWYPMYNNQEKIKFSEKKIYKCYLENMNVLDKNGGVNKEELIKLMQKDSSQKITEEVIQECIAKKEDPLETAYNIWRCIN